MKTFQIKDELKKQLFEKLASDDSSTVQEAISEFIAFQRNYGVKDIDILGDGHRKEIVRVMMDPNANSESIGVIIAGMKTKYGDHWDTVVANLINKAGKDSISYQWNGYHRSIEIVGIVKSHTENTSLIEVKNPIYSGQSYRVLSPMQSEHAPTTVHCLTVSGTPISHLTPNECGFISQKFSPNSIIVQDIHD